MISSQFLINTKSCISKTITVDQTYLIEKKIYKGQGYSNIFLASNFLSGEVCAIKMLKGIFNKIFYQHSQTLQNEGKITGRISHPNVIQIVSSKFLGEKIVEKSNGKAVSKNIVYIALEYAERGDIFEFVRVSQGFNEKIALFFFKQIIDGVEAIHKVGLCHRDVKLENILLNKNYQVKITDFEFATELINQKGEYLKLKSKVGSERYMAPEMHFLHFRERYYYGDKVDVFSCGIVLLAMLSGKLYFERTSATDFNYRTFSQDSSLFFARITKIKPISQPVINLLVSMLNPNYQERISIEEIKNTDVYSSIDTNANDDIIVYLDNLWDTILKEKKV